MRRYAFLVAAFVAAAVCVRLGLWQFRRLDERRKLNAERAARLALGPLDIGDHRELDSSMSFRRAVLDGQFDFARQIVVMGRSRRGVPGVHIVTPLRLADGSSLLVERGWAPSPDGRSVDLQSYGEAMAARVVGVLLYTGLGNGSTLGSDSAWPHYVRRATPNALRAAYPYPIFDFVLRRTEEPDPSPAGLRLVPLPELSDGPHLSYAIQWLAFAMIAVVGSIALVRRDGRRLKAGCRRQRAEDWRLKAR